MLGMVLIHPLPIILTWKAEVRFGDGGHICGSESGRSDICSLAGVEGRLIAYLAQLQLEMHPTSCS